MLPISSYVHKRPHQHMTNRSISDQERLLSHQKHHVILHEVRWREQAGIVLKQ